MSDDADNHSECVYCGHDVEDLGAPAVGDDDAWMRAAAQHAVDCEWVVSRAHRWPEDARRG